MKFREDLLFLKSYTYPFEIKGVSVRRSKKSKWKSFSLENNYIWKFNLIQDGEGKKPPPPPPPVSACNFYKRRNYPQNLSGL